MCMIISILAFHPQQAGNHVRLGGSPGLRVLRCPVNEWNSCFQMPSESPKMSSTESANGPVMAARHRPVVDKRILGIAVFISILGATYLLSRSASSTAPAPSTPVAASSLEGAVFVVVFVVF